MKLNQKYLLGKELGCGRFGKVYLGIDKATSKKVAIKVIFKELLENEDDLEYQTELDILKIIDHEYIIKLIEYFDDEKKVYIVTDYHSGGELFKKLENKMINDVIGGIEKSKRRGLAEYTVTQYILQLSEAIEYLHNLNIVHRDIKPENIILSEDGTIKLCDFGWSMISKFPSKKICGTLDYICPEMVNGKSHDYRVDLWTIGVLTYELLTGVPPFISKTYEETYDRISKVQYNLPNYLSNNSKDFITSLLVFNPKDRMDISMIKNHPWINSNLKFNNF